MPAFRSLPPTVPANRRGQPASAHRHAQRPHRLVAVIAALALALAACSGSATPRPTTPPDATGSLVPPVTATPPPSVAPSPAFPVTLTDDEETTVELTSEPRKIVSLTPAETEILVALGVGDRVVGKVEDFTPYPPEVTAIPDVAKYGDVDVEKIVALEADLVIAGGNSFNPPDKIAQLRRLGVPVIVVYAPDVAGVLRDIELTGAAVGKPAEAAALTASMQAAFDQVAAATRDLPKPRVFYELDASGKIYTTTDDSFLTEMIILAGGDPITTGSTTNSEIPLERLVMADPELILLGDAAYGTTAEVVKARAGWGVMTAVRKGAIVGVDDVVISRPGPRLVDGLRALTLAIHPDADVPSPQPPASAVPAASAAASAAP